MGAPDWSELIERVGRLDTIRISGRVMGARGLLIESVGPPAQLGELCAIVRGRNAPPLTAEVVGFQRGNLLLMPLGELTGVAIGSEVLPLRQQASVAVGDALLGRILDGTGQPLDGKPLPPHAPAVRALSRSTSRPGASTPA
jgi:flagellum-specific ATP synthase